MALYETLKEAVRAWVNEFSRFPTDMIDTLMQADPESWCEITYPGVGDRVCGYYFGGGEVTKCIGNEKYEIKTDDGDVITAKYIDEFEIEWLEGLPMWGAMWQFGDPCDEHWIEDKENQQKMSGCGFRIYQHEEWGYFFGIDGAGYDFFEAHWEPLYKAVGLKWHDKEDGSS